MWLLSSLLENAFVSLGWVEPGQECHLYAVVYVLLAALILFSTFCIYYGLWFGPKQTLRQLNQMSVIVTDKQCKYENLQKAFEDMLKDLQPIYKTPNSRSIGIYLDNPMLVKEGHMCRCMLGFILASPLQQEIAEQIASRTTRYRIINLPQVEALHLAVPYKNFITFFLMGFFWGSLKLPTRHGEQNQIHNEKQMVGVEIYDLEHAKHIHIYMPLERHSEFIKSRFPRPEYHRSRSNVGSRSVSPHSRPASARPSRPPSRSRQSEEVTERRTEPAQSVYEYSRAPSQRISASQVPQPQAYVDPLEQFRMSNSSPIPTTRESGFMSPRLSGIPYTSEYR